MNRKLIMFINDWGSNPNERVFYIADYFKRLGCDIVFIGRTYKDMPNREYFSSIHHFNEFQVIDGPANNLVEGEIPTPC